MTRIAGPVWSPATTHLGAGSDDRKCHVLKEGQCRLRAVDSIDQRIIEFFMQRQQRALSEGTSQQLNRVCFALISGPFIRLRTAPYSVYFRLVHEKYETE